MRLAPAAAVDRTLGEEACAFAAGYGLVADDWQELIVEDWLLLSRSGLYACLTCGLAVPRQNGKNGALEIRELYGMVALGEKFLHTAHEVKTARKAFKRLKYFFGEKANDPAAKFPELNALVLEVRNTNGQEAIVLHADDCAHRQDAARLCSCAPNGGGSVEFVARSKGSGRGYTVDVLVCDEAQDLKDDELEALLSTISAAPLGNPQIIFTGTPPNPEKKQTGEVFVRVRKDGMTGADKALSWIDFGIKDQPLEDIDLDDRDQLYAVNPAMGGRLQERVAKTERRRLSAAGYARERLGWWGEPDSSGRQTLFGAAWRKRRRKGKAPKPVALGVAVSIDLAWSSIGAAGQLRNGNTYLGAVDRRRGTGWLLDQVLAYAEKTGCPVVIDGRGPGAFLIDELEDAGVTVLVASSADVMDACAAVFDGITERGDVVHGDHPELNDAAEAAEKRMVGDRFAWGRTQSLGDISMLEAVTLAKHGLDAEYDVMDSIG